VTQFTQVHEIYCLNQSVACAYKFKIQCSVQQPSEKCCCRKSRYIHRHGFRCAQLLYTTQRKTVLIIQGRSRRSGHGLATYSATKFFFYYSLPFKVIAQPPALTTALRHYMAGPLFKKADYDPVILRLILQTVIIGQIC